MSIVAQALLDQIPCSRATRRRPFLTPATVSCAGRRYTCPKSSRRLIIKAKVSSVLADGNLASLASTSLRVSPRLLPSAGLRGIYIGTYGLTIIRTTFPNYAVPAANLCWDMFPQRAGGSTSPACLLKRGRTPNGKHFFPTSSSLHSYSLSSIRRQCASSSFIPKTPRMDFW